VPALQDALYICSNRLVCAPPNTTPLYLLRHMKHTLTAGGCETGSAPSQRSSSTSLFGGRKTPAVATSPPTTPPTTRPALASASPHAPPTMAWRIQGHLQGNKSRGIHHPRTSNVTRIPSIITPIRNSKMLSLGAGAKGPGEVILFMRPFHSHTCRKTAGHGIFKTRLSTYDDLSIRLLHGSPIPCLTSAMNPAIFSTSHTCVSR
jgi:hypothetical protein